MDMDTLLCLTWRTSKDLLTSTGDSAQYSVITLSFPGGRMGEEIVTGFGKDMDTLLCLTWRTSKDLLDSTGNSAPCHMVAWMGGELGEKGCSVCMAESLCCPPETITTWFISYTPLQNKKVKKNSILVSSGQQANAIF